MSHTPLRTAGSLQQSPLRAVPGLRRPLRGGSRASWRGAGIVVAFSAIYAITLSIGPRAGSPAAAVQDYLRCAGIAVALFLPAYGAVMVVAPFAPGRFAVRALVMAMAVVVALLVGQALVAAAAPPTPGSRGNDVRHAGALLPVLLTCWLGLAVHLLHERARTAEQDLHDEAEHRLELAHRLAEGRLSVLQSQIEPHFLFNSLAHVRHLCRRDIKAGQAMLRNLAHYIGAAHQLLHLQAVPLATDIELAVSYLEVQRIRMGSRLRYVVDLDPAAAGASIPPMTVTTLVENAIKHGLSRLEEGGQVSIAARVEGHGVVVRVRDDGRGLQSTMGSGVGVANVSARLAMLHGPAASLALAVSEPRGVVATVRLPLGVLQATSA